MSLGRLGVAAALSVVASIVGGTAVAAGAALAGALIVPVTRGGVAAVDRLPPGEKKPLSLPLPPLPPARPVPRWWTCPRCRRDRRSPHCCRRRRSRFRRHCLRRRRRRGGRGGRCPRTLRHRRYRRRQRPLPLVPQSPPPLPPAPPRRAVGSPMAERGVSNAAAVGMDSPPMSESGPRRRRRPRSPRSGSLRHRPRC